MAGYVAKPAEPGRTLPCTDSLSVPCAHALVRERERERRLSRACQLPGRGFLSSVAPESDSISLICLSHMKVLEHL